MKDFEGLYRSYLPAVYRMCMRYVGRPEVAEEIASEAFLALYQQRDSVEEDRLPGWLFSVAKRKAIDYWRHEQLAPALEVRDSVQPDFEQELDVKWLLQRCDRLTPEHRVCLLLRYMHGMSRSEIAAQTGLDEMQVKSNLQYSLKLLRDELVKGNRTDVGAER